MPPSKPISLSIHLASTPVFLFPIFHHGPNPTRDDANTVLRGEVHASVNMDEVDVEGLEVTWEVGVAQRSEEKEEWRTRVPWGSYQGVVVDFDKTMKRGKYMIPFTISLPTWIPSSRQTPFDKITHTLRASFTTPSPTYTVHDTSAPPSRKGSIASFRDLHLGDSPSSRRGSGSPILDDNSPPPFSTGAFVFPNPTTTSEPSTVLTPGPSTSILNRQNTASPGPSTQPKPRFKLPFLNLESRRRSSLDRSLPTSRRSSLDQRPISRNASTTSLNSSKDDNAETGLGEGLGHGSMVVEVISVPKGTVNGGPNWNGDIPSFKWDFRENLRGLGGLEGRMSSSCFVLGSGLVADITLYDLNPLATLHSISLNFTQSTKTPDTLQTDNELYILFQDGKPNPSTITDNIWQGDLSRANIAAQTKSKSKSHHKASADEPTPTEYHIRRKVRLPSPAIGAFARYAFTPNPPYSTQTEHDLRLDILYSVYGQTSSGNPYPPHLKPPIYGGGLQSARLFHHVYMYDCSASPSNLVLPGYDTEAPKLGYVEKVEKGNIPGAFTMPRQTSRVLGTENVDIRGELSGRGGLVERVERHRKETGGRCLCLLDEEDVWRAVGEGKDELEEVIERAEGEQQTGVKAVYEQP